MLWRSIIRVAIVLALASNTSAEIQRPNVLWITSEDNGPYLGCYGDPLAKTPHLDRLAEDGIRYRLAFANAPVCSASRSTLISGMSAATLGIHHHRSRVAIPAEIPLYPELMRAAGYYCTNNSKTDYNIAGSRRPWDESSNRAHYRNRRPGQPFFAVFNITLSHESQVAPQHGKTKFRIAPARIPLPPYHPDTAAIRTDWANYYDQMTLMDARVGELLAELEQLGEANDTLVFYFSDHAGALPRGKRNLHDSGTRIPLIIRIPEKWRQHRPVAPGEWVEDPVGLIDLPVTLFSLCGVKKPQDYQGQPFLGADRNPTPREHVFLFRGRMDERYDNSRAVRSRQFRYIRNFSPHRPWGQHYAYPFRVQPSMRSWNAEYRAGRCDPVQSSYWEEKPAEEFYDVTTDPHEVRNRIGDPTFTAEVADMRRILRQEILATRDTAFIPEGMFAMLAKDRTIYDYAQSDAYPLGRLLELAEKASERKAINLPVFQEAMQDPNPLVRYWGATGCLLLQERASPAKADLEACLLDDVEDVRIVAAEAFAWIGNADVSTKVLSQMLQSRNLYSALAAENSIDFLRADNRISLDTARKLTRYLDLPEPADRIPKYFLELLPPDHP